MTFPKYTTGRTVQGAQRVEGTQGTNNGFHAGASGRYVDRIMVVGVVIESSPSDQDAVAPVWSRRERGGRNISDGVAAL